MTNGWIDIKNTDMMLIMGGNPAENHPCGFKWPIEAKLQRNAKMIVVDPRFTRTAATADLFLQIRAGSDIAFLGGLINYAIENGRIAHDYLVNYTNAAFIVNDGFKLPEMACTPVSIRATQTYDKSTWNYEACRRALGGEPQRRRRRGAAGNAHGARRCADARGPPAHRQDARLARRPRDRRYDPTLPASALRVSAAQAAVLALHAGDGRAHHRHPEGSIPEGRRPVHVRPQGRRHEEGRRRSSTPSAGRSTRSGTQIIRTAAMLQLLLGNVGRAGGGVNALRGHSNIQGATDMAGVFDILPGYLKMPAPDDVDLATYLKRTTPTSSKPPEWDSFNYWSNTPKFAVSFLKAMYGDAAQKGERLGVSLSAEDRSQVLVGRDLGRHVRRASVKGMFAVRHERRADRAELAARTSTR